MTHRLLTALAIVLLPGCASTSPTERGDVAAELRAITDSTILALKNGDRAFFERLLAEDYIGTAMNGRVIERDEFFATFQPPPAAMNPQFEVTDLRIVTHGATAVLNARRDFRGEMNGQPISQSERTTQVFVRDGGRWRLLAEHSSPVADGDG